jgi:hypothetical protein
MNFRRKIFALVPVIFLCAKIMAQENYEIQVYGSKTVDVKTTMVELHSNFTFSAPDSTSYGVYSSNNSFHETVEITHGFTPWMEVGFYFFNSIGNNMRTNYVGSHIRPRFAVPESCGWPLGLSISFEYGIQRREFSEDVQTLEIRPIIDKKWNKLYMSFNPTLEKSFKGYNERLAPVFSPNIKGSFDFTSKLTLGLEYYGSIGPLNNFYAPSNMDHQLFLAADINGFPKWEFNFGVGAGLDQNSQGYIIKTIVGRRF